LCCTVHHGMKCAFPIRRASFGGNSDEFEDKIRLSLQISLDLLVGPCHPKPHELPYWVSKVLVSETACQLDLLKAYQRQVPRIVG